MRRSSRSGTGVKNLGCVLDHAAPEDFADVPAAPAPDPVLILVVGDAVNRALDLFFSDPERFAANAALDSRVCDYFALHSTMLSRGRNQWRGKTEGLTDIIGMMTRTP